MSYPTPTPHVEPTMFGIHYVYTRPRGIIFSVDTRHGLLMLYRNALRRCGREDGWTQDIELQVREGVHAASFNIRGEDCKHFAEELAEMGLDRLAASVDSFAWGPTIEAAELQHQFDLERMTSL